LQLVRLGDSLDWEILSKTGKRLTRSLEFGNQRTSTWEGQTSKVGPGFQLVMKLGPSLLKFVPASNQRSIFWSTDRQRPLCALGRGMRGDYSIASLTEDCKDTLSIPLLPCPGLTALYLVAIPSILPSNP
jgi:hypothetical protein